MMRTARLAPGVLLAALLSAPAAGTQPDPVRSPERGVELADRRDERDPDRLGWYVPDFARVQTGGFVGMFAVGTGYAIFDDVLNVSAHYGFTPATHAGHDVHAFSFETLLRPLDFRIDDFRIVPIYLGPGLLYAWGDEYFTRLPGRYRDRSYYPPTSLHWTARAGIELDWLPPSGVFERHGLFYELTMLDAFFDFYRENPETLDPIDVLAGAVGYRAAF
jgi:hypothetical protein